jgi:hypothetical protein
MAKAKKSDSASKSEAPAGEKKPAKKAAAKAAAPQVNPAVPSIDTSAAAAAAARLVAHRDQLGSSGEKKESSSFKQLKESLHKPAIQGPASFLQNTAPVKKGNLPFGGRNQVGHNQTFGADVNRSGVPRRSGG